MTTVVALIAVGAAKVGESRGTSPWRYREGSSPDDPTNPLHPTKSWWGAYPLPFSQSQLHRPTFIYNLFFFERASSSGGCLPRAGNIEQKPGPISAGCSNTIRYDFISTVYVS